LLFFDKKKFDNYWFRTGTPTFLLELVRKYNKPQSFFEAITVPSEVFESYDPDNIGELPLLFQTGYLTVKKEERDRNMLTQYTLDFPNYEVKSSFLRYLLSYYTGYPIDRTYTISSEISRYIDTKDERGLERSLNALLSNIPYQIQIEKEAYYHSIFLIWLKTLGFNIKGEVSTREGRIDAVLEEEERVVVTEIEHSISKPIEEMIDLVMKQIKEKEYYKPYIGKNIMLLGIAFNGKEIACRMDTGLCKKECVKLL
jgi:hypothetical protein